MTFESAREIASEWVGRNVARFPEVRGAFLHGSVCYLPEGGSLDASSDIDVVVVYEDQTAGGFDRYTGKHRFRDVLIDISFLPAGVVDSADTVLANHNLAGSLAAGGVLFDRDGRLTATHESVSARFSQAIWVRRRCKSALEKSEAVLSGVSPDRPIYDQGLRLLFGLGIQTHVLLVAARENPTVRRRYERCRDLLTAHDAQGVQEEMLDLLGSRAVTKPHALTHLSAMTRAFEDAVGVIRPDSKNAVHINPHSRSSNIEGSRNSIESGLHREAMFWIGSMLCRCVLALAENSSSDRVAKHGGGLAAVLEELGIPDSEAMRRRRDGGLRNLPHVWETAERIMGSTE